MWRKIDLYRLFRSFLLTMRTAAIIPAYNEELTVGDVVRRTRASGLVDEVIVVNDGSTDNTSFAARNAGATVIDLPKNLGKGAALRVGIEGLNADLILFLDADLVGLEGDHIRSLLEPVRSGEADMSLGIFAGGRFSTDLAQKIAPFLSGQRAIRGALLSGLSAIDVNRFGVEIALTRFVLKNNLRVKRVILRGLTHRMKEEKLGFLRGFIARLKMYYDIVVCYLSR